VIKTFQASVNAWSPVMQVKVNLGVWDEDWSINANSFPWIRSFSRLKIGIKTIFFVEISGLLFDKELQSIKTGKL
jgi:hypothetical protein